MGQNENFPAEHRPHGTLAHCSIFVDPMRVVVSQDPRWNKDIRVQHPQNVRVIPRTVPLKSRAQDYKLVKQSGSGSGSMHSHLEYISRGMSEADRTAQRRCSQSAVGRAPPPPTPPFRLGGRVGGSGTPGAQAQRWQRRAGDVGWVAVMDAFEQAPAVRDRLHVKAGFPHRPPPEPPFVRHPPLAASRLA